MIRAASVMLQAGPNGEAMLVPVRRDGADWVPWTEYGKARLQSRQSPEVSHSSEVGFHNSTPLAHRDMRGDMSEAIGTKPRISARSYEDRSETRTSLHVRLVEHVTEPAKVVAKKVGTSPDSIDSYRQGNVPQSWAQMIAIARAYPGFALDVMEMMGIDIDQDRTAYAQFLALKNMVQGGGK